MKSPILAKLAFSAAALPHRRGNESRNYREYCTAHWLLNTKASEEIKTK